LTFSSIEELHEAGAKFKSTRLSESFTYRDFLVKNGDRSILLCALTDEGRLLINTVDDAVDAAAGDDDRDFGDGRSVAQETCGEADRRASAAGRGLRPVTFRIDFPVGSANMEPLLRLLLEILPSPFLLLLAAVPLVSYLGVIAAIRVSGRALITTGGRDIAAIGVAIAGLMAIGPAELVFPAAAATVFGPIVWLWLAMFYVLCVALDCFDRPSPVGGLWTLGRRAFSPFIASGSTHGPGAMGRRGRLASDDARDGECTCGSMDTVELTMRRWWRSSGRSRRGSGPSCWGICDKRSPMRRVRLRGAGRRCCCWRP
jgi:hypothetical protein